MFVRDKGHQVGLNKKLQSVYKGPYRIVKVNDNETFVLKIRANKLQTYHHNLLKPFIAGDDASNSGLPSDNPVVPS